MKGETLFASKYFCKSFYENGTHLSYLIILKYPQNCMYKCTKHNNAPRSPTTSIQIVTCGMIFSVHPAMWVNRLQNPSVTGDFLFHSSTQDMSNFLGAYTPPKFSEITSAYTVTSRASATA